MKRNNLIQTTLLVCLAIALPATLHAQFNYYTNNGGITIFYYSGPGGAVTIPDTIDGPPVTTIEGGAFWGTSLTSITIGQNLTYIGAKAFSGSSLAAITVDPLNNVFSSVDGVMFNKNATTLINYPEGRAGSYTIPGGVTTIGEAAFLRCANLVNVAIPDSVTNIGAAAFSGCTGLTRITIPGSVMGIGEQGFAGCANLSSITIPDSVTYIGPQAFVNCSSLTGISVDVLNDTFSDVEGVLFNKNQTTLIQCPGKKSGTYHVPTSVDYIQTRAFSGCAGLTNVTIPNSVTYLGDYAFGGCFGLANVSLGTNISTLPGGAFSGCSNLSSVTIPNSVTYIRPWAFRDCTSLASITIPGRVTRMGGASAPNTIAGSFIGCTGLKRVYFEGQPPSIVYGDFTDHDEFTGCEQATVYYLPGTIGWGAFFGGRPTALWLPTLQASQTSFGLPSHPFGFTISWARDKVVVIEAATDLSQPTWSPLSTNTFVGGSATFSDPQWTNYPMRVYRARTP